MTRKNLFQILYSIVTLLIVLVVSAGAHAQTLDKIVAIVGKNRIILQSEIDAEAANYKQQMPDFHDSMKCDLLQQMIMRKMLVEQAERDSLLVADEEVDGTLEQRIRYFISMYGSKEKLEEISGKTIYQLKEENREIIKEGMLAERMQGKILQNIKVTPAEVQNFYRQIPADSLPFFPAAVEMGQIVIDPPLNPELEAYTRQEMENIRKDIVQGGKDFEVMAGLHSQDPGSRDNGGDLGTISRTDVVPEFAAAAYKLQNGEVSPVIKSKFGFHIIQMVARRGDQVHVRHILKRPERTSGDFKIAMAKLDSVRAQLVAGTLTFQEAVGKYSTDEMSSRTGGMIADQQTGSTTLEIDKLDPALALMIDTLKPGSFSKPQVFDKGNGEKSTRIVYMRSISEPHKANLKDDYGKIQEVALQQKKAKKLDQWMAEKSPSYYLKVDEEYQSCANIQQMSNAKK
jgi:peptidyl-prolyl cis-trans isomerase SurA